MSNDIDAELDNMANGELWEFFNLVGPGQSYVGIRFEYDLEEHETLPDAKNLITLLTLEKAKALIEELRIQVSEIEGRSVPVQPEKPLH